MFLPEILFFNFYPSMQHFKWKSCSVGSPDLKTSTAYSCGGGLNGGSLNFEFNADASRAEDSDHLKSPRPKLLYWNQSTSFTLSAD